MTLEIAGQFATAVEQAVQPLDFQSSRRSDYGR